MTDYVVMFPADDEATWDTRTDAERQATFDTDYEFGQLLAARGGAVTGGAGLTHSREGRTITSGPHGTAVVTEGPYAETVEQLSGFFLVTCDDYDALVEAAQVLVRAHPVVEIRPVQEF
ncbi:YciI family protein [Nocardioides conyzicola]|uniref:YciI family protein n=1 Tax=Nocardioides conyzicola TaxID=1651781 RepID=A0ABP8X9J6_9ACTN